MRAMTIIFVMLGILTIHCENSNDHNQLTRSEKAEGWTLLFDGESTNGWRGVNCQDVPECWQVLDSSLIVNPPGTNTEDCGDIMTTETYGDFELVWDWKMHEPGANSGVKYYVVEDLSSGSGGIGLEYQLLDDQNHEWMQDGRMQPNDYHTLAALYELYPPSPEKIMNPVEEWNRSRIVSQNKNVEHWLNGTLVLEFERGSEDFRARVAKSKFAEIESFGEAKRGHILLQHHGSTVEFRNIKIRVLD